MGDFEDPCFDQSLSTYIIKDFNSQPSWYLRFVVPTSIGKRKGTPVYVVLLTNLADTPVPGSKKDK